MTSVPATSYVLIEAMKDKHGEWASVVDEYDGDFNLLERRFVDFKLETENKGFEGIAYVYRRDPNADRGEEGFLVLLCEGNLCRAGKAGRTPGGGRVHVFRKGKKRWKHAKQIDLPPWLPFEDYSGIEVLGDYIAITSQASAMAWVARVIPGETVTFDEGALFEFPRDAQGKVIFCNVEGVTWGGKGLLVTVSDRMKQAIRTSAVHSTTSRSRCFGFPTQSELCGTLATQVSQKHECHRQRSELRTIGGVRCVTLGAGVDVFHDCSQAKEENNEHEASTALDAVPGGGAVGRCGSDGGPGRGAGERTRGARLAQADDVSGTYVSNVYPAASAPGLVMLMSLYPNNNAEVVNFYFSNPPITETGTWELSDGKVVVTLTENDNGKYDTPSKETFDVQGDMLVSGAFEFQKLGVVTPEELEAASSEAAATAPVTEHRRESRRPKRPRPPRTLQPLPR